MSNTAQDPKDRHPSRFKELAALALRQLRQNAGFKILALLLAILLWAGLITQDPSLTRERTFSDVNVNVIGADSLQRNGFIVVSDLNEVLSDVTMRVAVPQMQYQTANASNYNVRIDLSRITEPGTQSLRILTANSTYGTVLDVTPSEVEVTVEAYTTRYRIPVRINAIGNAPDGFYATTPTADPPMITISGPQSLVERIVCAEATLELDKLPAREGLSRRAVSFQLLDEDSAPIESSLLEITSESVRLDSVIIEQQIYSLKALPLSDVGILRGKPADGYEVKNITITPDVITVAGRADVLAELDMLYPEIYVDLSGLTESINPRVRLRDPGNLAYTSANTVTVAVEIGPIIRETTFNDIRLGIQHVESGMTASLGTENASVTISGPALWLDRLRQSDITLYCDASGLLAGTYQLPVLCELRGSDGQSYSVNVVPSTIPVTISAK